MLDPSLTVEGYAAALWALSAGAERVLQIVANHRFEIGERSPALRDFERRIAVLRSELEGFRFEFPVVADSLVDDLGLPDSDLAAAFGALYVFEGSVLGARVVLPHLVHHFGPTVELSYLRSLASEPSVTWVRFRDALAGVLAEGGQAALQSAEKGAGAVFNEVIRARAEMDRLMTSRLSSSAPSAEGPDGRDLGT